MNRNRTLNLRTAPISRRYWVKKNPKQPIPLVTKTVRKCKIGRIDEGHLIQFLVTDPIEHFNNSNVALRRHNYQHRMTGWLPAGTITNSSCVCFSQHVFTMDPTNVENGRGKVPHDPSLPFASTFSGMSFWAYLPTSKTQRRQFNPVIWTQDQHFHAENRCSAPSMIFLLLSVKHFKHLVFSRFQSTFEPF